MAVQPVTVLVFLNNLGVMPPQVGKTQLSLTDFWVRNGIFPLAMLFQVFCLSSNVCILILLSYFYNQTGTQFL